jgi:glycosyltransferase involved in cell wall biosynthesis
MGWFFARWLKQRGYAVIAVCPPRGAHDGRTIMDDLREAEVEVINYDGFEAILTPASLSVAVGILRERRVSMVICMYVSDLKVFGLAAWITHAALAVSVQNEVRFYGSAISRMLKKSVYQLLLRRKAALTMCTSEKISESIRNLYGVSSRRVVVLPNCVNTNVYRRSETADGRDRVRGKLEIRPEQIFILSVGKIHVQKGYTIAAEAIAKLIRHGHNIVWAIAGEVVPGDLESMAYRHDLQGKLASLGLTQNVRFLGWREDIPALLCAADCFLHAALWEGYPLAVLEAMAAATPTVFTDCFGIPQGFLDGAHGFIAKTGDVDSIAEKLESLLDLPTDGKQQIGRKSEQYVRELYAESVIAGLFISHINSVLRTLKFSERFSCATPGTKI